LWILHDQDKISILNPLTGVFTTNRIGKRSHLPEDPCSALSRYRYINFVKTTISGSIDCENIQYKDLAILIDTRDQELLLLDVNGDILTKLDISLIKGLKNTVSPIFRVDGDFTGYQYLRKFKSFNKNLSWKFSIGKTGDTIPEILSLTYDTSLLHPGWHHFTFTFDAENGRARYYIDSVLVDSKTFDNQKQLLFKFRSSLLLGANSVNNNILNDLIDIQDAYKFIGDIADLRIYDKVLSEGDVEQLYFSFKYSDNRKDLVWNMLTGSRNYIEEIQHWFQMQLPGSKSKYFNINIHNFEGPDEVKMAVESAIRNNITKLAPAHTSLYKINWI